MADLKIDKKKERDLRAALIPAVFHGYSEVVQGAGEALNKYFPKYESQKAKKSRRSAATSEERRLKTTGPQMLDFLVECCYDSKNKTWRREIPAKCRSKRSPLMIALQKDKTDVARQLINLGASVAFKNKTGLTALHIASIEGQTEMVRLILETAAQQKRFCFKKGDKKDLDSDLEVIINAKGPKGWTALMFAVNYGHLEIVRILMSYDLIDYEKQNRREQNVFHVAARSGNLQCLKELSTKSPPELMLTSDKKNWNILHQTCCYSSSLELLQWLLDNVPELKTQAYLNQKSKRGYTPLLVACKYHHKELVECLVETTQNLVDVTVCCHEEGERGISGLHLAADTDAVEVAKLLIKAGCPLEQKDRDGNTALHVAYKKGVDKDSDSVASVLVEKCSELIKIENDEKKVPSQMLEEFTIPLEIKKRGDEAIKIYIEALNEGKDKIPRCNFLILGKEKMGKTSLYRQCVGKKFDLHLKSTRGIDNFEVDTVDRRCIDIETWHEKEDPNSGEQFMDTLGANVVSKLPKKPDNEVRERSISPEDLVFSIQRTVREIEEEIERSRRPPKVFHQQPYPAQLTPSLSYPPPSTASAPPPKRVRLTEASPAQPPLPPPTPPPTTQPSQHPPAVKEDPPKHVVPPVTKPKSPPVEHRAPTPSPPPEDAVTPTLSEDSEEEVAEPSLHRGINVSRRQRLRMDEMCTGKRHPVKLTLTFNTLDFAGQPHYRPMHHCYISRRAIYVVVFSIKEMLKHIKLSADEPWRLVQDIRYWIQSINAHIYPPDEKEKEGDKIHKRVLLVGTHRGEHTLEELKKIDSLIKSQLLPLKTCVNHIHPVSGNGLDYFIAVENSIDCTTGATYLEKSGTKFLKDNIKSISNNLKFLQDDHPIKWLNFEDCLDSLRKERYPPVINVQELEELAVRCGITNESQRKLALRFFHDTGKIVYLEYYPHLFLSESQCKKLQNLVILSVDWLASVMKVIMELKTTHMKTEVRLTQEQIQRLETTGKADLEVLGVCWEKFVSSPESTSEFKVTLNHLCLILQSYCLIYPVPSSTESRAENNSNSTDSSDPVEVNSRTFIIPCKLPEQFEDPKKQCKLRNFISFIFNFIDFLPAEIYHRLICLASRDSKPPSGYKNKFSGRKCFIRNLFDTHWVMELDSDQHKLCFQVIAKKPKKDRHLYIQVIHRYLYDICDDSRLQGLVYYGGVECKECQDELFHFVAYDNGVPSSIRKPNCQGCLNDYDRSELLDLPEQASSCATQQELDIDNKGEVLREIKKAAAAWEYIGLALNLQPDLLDQIKHDHSEVGDRLSEVVSKWLKSTGERTWNFLCKALEDDLVERSDLAKTITRKKIK